MENIKQDVQKIKQIIEELKPKYSTLGGDIEFVDIKDMTRMDLVRAIGERIKAEIPWVKMVVVAPQNVASQ